MKTFLVVFAYLIVSIFPAYGQKAQGNIASVQNQLNLVKHDTCLDKKFSVVLYLIQDSVFSITSNTTSQISYSIPNFFTRANNTFSRICVSFELCKTVIIPDYTFNEWQHFGNGLNVLQTYYTENTICIFIPEGLKPWLPDDPEGGYTFRADTTPYLRNSIVISKIGFKGSSIFHQLGHFFGLPHTFFEINPNQATVPPTPNGIVSKEFADKSNCATHGDGFCDTEADPFPAASNLPYASQLNCFPTGIKDGKGRFYSPPFENYMSVYGCRCEYSNQQYDHMARYIIKNRMYLH